MGIFDKPKLRRGNKKKDTVPDDLWTKCPDCGELIHTLDLKQNFQVCIHCNHHFLMGASGRIALLADPDSFEETDAGMSSANPLGFEKYDDKIALLKEKTKLTEEFTFDDFQARYGDSAVILFLIDEPKKLVVRTVDQSSTPQPGQTVIAIVDAISEENPSSATA